MTSGRTVNRETVTTSENADHPLFAASLIRRLRTLRFGNAGLLILAALVGALSSIGVTLFLRAIDFFTQFYRQALQGTLQPALGALAIIPIVAFGGLIVGLVLHRFIGEERHHGVAGIIEAVALTGGRLRYWRMPIKVTMAALSLGAGASTGPEDPSVQLGANLGSMVGQWLHLPDDWVRLLVAAGVASGLASAFQAPIAGVFFALELILLGAFSTSDFSVIVLAAVIATALTQAINPGGPELGVLTYDFRGLQELPLYLLLGLAMAFVSAGVIRLYYAQQDWWHHRTWPVPIRTLVGGALVGVIAIGFPQILGTGRDTLRLLTDTNAPQQAITALLVLALIKAFAATLSLGSGFSGGIFAPSLFIGAAVGSAFGQIMHLIIPGMAIASPAAYAIAGMAAAMTGVIRAPLTSIMLLFELSTDYRLILPLMLTTVTCLVVVNRLAPHGFYQVALTRKGFPLDPRRPTDVTESITVKQVMNTEFTPVHTDWSIAQVAATMADQNTHGLLVIDADGWLAGIVTSTDLGKAYADHLADESPVTAIFTRDLITTTPDESLAAALRRMSVHNVGRLPVVDQAVPPYHAVGLLRRRDVIAAYEILEQRQKELAELRKQVEAG